MPWSNTISIPQVRWYREHQPEYLTALYTTVYDEHGIPTRIRAYKLEEMLSRGFLAAPPGEEAPEGMTPPEPSEALPAPTKGIRTPRLAPGRGGG